MLEMKILELEYQINTNFKSPPVIVPCKVQLHNFVGFYTHWKFVTLRLAY